MTKALAVRRDKGESKEVATIDEVKEPEHVVPVAKNDMSQATLKTSAGSFSFHNSLLVNPTFNLGGQPVEDEE